MAKDFRRLIVISFCIILVATLTSCGSQQTTISGSTSSHVETKFPENDIIAVCQFGAGGGNDVQMRAIAPYMKKYLPNNVNVVVENRTGGGGIVATNYVWNTKADGYTLLQAQMGTMLVQELTNDEIEFKNEAFEWLCIYSFDDLVIVVRPDFPANNWEELLEYSKNNDLKIGTAGAGSNTHMQAALFMEVTGLPGNLVHYSDGTAGVIGGFGRGEIDMYIFSVGTQSISAVENGNVRNFCVISDKENEYLPNIPTLTEIGLPEDVVEELLACPLVGAPRGIAAPPDTPAEIVVVLDSALQEALNDPELVEWAQANKLNWTIMNAEETQQWVQQGQNNMLAYEDLLLKVVGG